MALWRAGEKDPDAGSRVSGSEDWRGSEDRRSLRVRRGFIFLLLLLLLLRLYILPVGEKIIKIIKIIKALYSPSWRQATCPCSCRRNARLGGDLQEQSKKRGARREMATLAASPNVGIGSVPVRRSFHKNTFFWKFILPKVDSWSMGQGCTPRPAPAPGEMASRGRPGPENFEDCPAPLRPTPKMPRV